MIKYPQSLGVTSLPSTAIGKIVSTYHYYWCREKKDYCWVVYHTDSAHVAITNSYHTFSYTKNPRISPLVLAFLIKRVRKW